jgi:hypothetical protein
MARLGPLGGGPALNIALPGFRFNLGEVPGGTGGAVARIPGGYLASVTVAEPSNFTTLYGQSILMAVNDDGTIRWRQCRTDGFTGEMFVALGADLVPTQAVIVVAQGPQTTNTVEFDHRIIDLADGRDEGTVHDRAVAAGLDPAYVADQVRGRHDRFLLLTGSSQDFGVPDRAVTSRDRIVRLDLSTMQVEVLRPPRAALGLKMGAPWLSLTEAGDPAVRAGGFEDIAHRPLALHHGGAWLGETAAGPELWGASFPLQVVLREDQPPQAVLAAVDAHGATVWSRSDVVSQGEAAASLTGGATTIAIICLVAVPPGGCPSEGLVGLDTTSGAERWRLNGAYTLGFAANDLAMVEPLGRTSVGPWQLIDLRTGSVVGTGQQWSDPNAFASDDGGCCATIDVTRQTGGMVTALHAGHISVWLPLSLTPRRTLFVVLT